MIKIIIIIKNHKMYSKWNTILIQIETVPQISIYPNVKNNSNIALNIVCSCCYSYTIKIKYKISDI